MSVKTRPHKNGGWEVDIRYRTPDGEWKRDRKKAPATSRSAALRWGQDRERFLLTEPPAQPRKEVPTLASFAPRFLDGYASANRQKPSGIAAKETILRVHLIPLLGRRRLDAITSEDVQRLKSSLRHRAPKTVNNVLSVLSMTLKVAQEWGVIEHMPCAIRQLRTTVREAGFHDFAEFERLVRGASKSDWRAHLIVLLGGQAGLRCGEMMALEWTDVDLERSQLRVGQSEWKGHVTVSKGGRQRRVPMTARLAEALRTYRHLRGPRVLCEDDGRPLTQKRVQILVRNAARLANLPNGGVHILRHTFCSHLAMLGVPPRAIQELAGHRDLSTSQRYMHLSQASIDDGIRKLEALPAGKDVGDMLESEGAGAVK